MAADAGLLDEAARYVRGGVLVARAAGNAPLAANIISTFSYQVANTGNPNEAIVLARTAYQGGRHDATPVTRALLLERVAWSAARSGDVRDCERTLGMVEESYSAGPSDNDPDWVYWLNREEIDIMAGRCYTELGNPRRAESLLTSAIARYDHNAMGFRANGVAGCSGLGSRWVTGGGVVPVSGGMGEAPGRRGIA